MIALETTVDLGQYGVTAAALRNLFSPAGRREINDSAATEVAELVRKHIADYARTAHTTADTIEGGPATRTGHLEWPNTDVVKGDVTAEEATVEIASPGFRRALGPLRIVQKTKPKLTVPVHAMAYGRTVADLVADGVRVFRPRGRDFLATTKKTADGAALIVLYALKDEVTLRHQPDLLPKDQAFKDSARDGVLNLLRAKLARRSAS